eukprot:7239243-Lingulodinium_polyedra.AAC.1
MRHVNAELHASPGTGSIRCLLSDSSPQGNEDWQITETYTVTAPLDTAAKVNRIIGLQSQVAASDEDQDMDEEALGNLRDEIAVLSREVCAAVRHHVLPPTGLGLRKGGMVHKLSVVLHSIYNESLDELELR